jgi:hypothetical protein
VLSITKPIKIRFGTFHTRQPGGPILIVNSCAILQNYSIFARSGQPKGRAMRVQKAIIQPKNPVHIGKNYATIKETTKDLITPLKSK